MTDRRTLNGVPASTDASTRNRRAERIAAADPESVLNAAVGVGADALSARAHGCDEPNIAQGLRLAAAELAGLVTPGAGDMRPTFVLPAWGWSPAAGYHATMFIPPPVAAQLGIHSVRGLWAHAQTGPTVTLPAPGSLPEPPVEGASGLPVPDTGRPLADVVRNRLMLLPAGNRLSALTVVVDAAGLGEQDRKTNVLFGASFKGGVNPDDEAALLELGSAPADDPDPATLFALAPDDNLVPSYLLQTYDTTGGPLVSRGRGGPAPVRQRLWLDALTGIVAADRTGDMRRFRDPLGDLADRLWPYGWDYQRSSWPTLQVAIEAINATRLVYRDRAGVDRTLHVIVFTDYPLRAPSPSAMRAAVVRGVITLPEGTDKGPTLSRAVLQHAGTISGPAQRLVVAWAFYRGRYLSRTDAYGRRRFTAPTLPRTRQDDAGRYLDATGAVLLDKHGQPIQRFKDPRVIFIDADGVPAPLNQAARVRNPALDRAPALTLDQWRRATITHPERDKRTAFKERQRIEAALADIAAAGIVGLEHQPGKRVRLISPGPVGANPSAADLRADHERRLEEARQRRRDRTGDTPARRLFDELEPAVPLGRTGNQGDHAGNQG